MMWVWAGKRKFCYHIDDKEMPAERERVREWKRDSLRENEETDQSTNTKNYDYCYRFFYRNNAFRRRQSRRITAHTCRSNNNGGDQWSDLSDEHLSVGGFLKPEFARYFHICDGKRSPRHFMTRPVSPRFSGFFFLLMAVVLVTARWKMAPRRLLSSRSRERASRDYDKRPVGTAARSNEIWTTAGGGVTRSRRQIALEIAFCDRLKD